MFIEKQTIEQQQAYKQYLQVIGSLSNLSSDSDIPYLYYRMAEKIFCRAFESEDLSRSDVSIDAKKDCLGIGLKTYLLGNNKTFQKVAEFNNNRNLYENLESKKLIKKVSQLRNARIEFTENTYGITNTIYHCVLRDIGKFKIFEESLDKIDIANIRLIKKSDSSIIFDDGNHEYSFLLSKSTLTKRFLTQSIIDEFEVEILENPLDELLKLFQEIQASSITKAKIKSTVYLPLYGKDKKVFEKSGLNQWNAEGRKRNFSEVYIPIPIKIHQLLPNFFPDRDTPFNLKLPSGENMKSKVCQDNNKALMSYSNKELGEWILRKVLQLKEGELLTYSKLQTIGIDSVRIDKINELEYEINFAEIGSYEQFITN
jgi:NgoFVII restriction endonuclease